jgi:hypothetical protein
MNKEEDKAAYERDVFTQFAAVAGLPLIPGSIESRRPPEPDILCELAGSGRVAFELVDLVDEGLARTVAEAVRRPDGGAGVWFGDPTLDTVRWKLTRKEYVTQHPTELLAYGGDTLPPYDVWRPKYEQLLEDVFDRAHSKFRRLWVVNLGRLAADQPIWLVHPPM